VNLLDFGLIGLASYAVYDIYNKFGNDSIKKFEQYKKDTIVPKPSTIPQIVNKTVHETVENYVPEIVPYYYGIVYDQNEIADLVYLNEITSGNFTFYTSFIDYLKVEQPKLYQNMSTTQRSNIMSYKVEDLIKYYRPISYLLGISEDESYLMINSFLEKNK
jgi:hypothetical protein